MMLRPFFFFSKMRKKSKSIMKRKIFDSHPVFDENYLKTKLKSYNGKNTKNFNCKVPKEGSKCLCLSLIVIDSVLKLNKLFSTYISRRMQTQNKKERNKIIPY